MSIFKKIIQSFERSGQRKTLYHLRTMPERQLIDCGFSPQLISEGLKSWPWRAESSIEESPGNEYLNTLEQQHVEQLQSYTDSELRDLGIYRGSILDCVRNGRPGVERSQTDEAA